MRRFLGSAPLFVLLGLLSRSAGATPGTHAPAVSTYDTRASSVVLAYRHGFSDAGAFNTFSYNANFSSTTGKLSAQFGIHYVNFAESEVDETAHGVAGSGVALFVFPVADRFEDGTPRAALSFDVGAVPTAFISGDRNFITLPLVLGFGVPLSPAPFITITPWYEMALSASLDTVVKPENVTIGPDLVVIDPQTGEATLSPDAVDAALEEGVEIDVGFAVPMRAGLDVALHASERVDFNLYAQLSTLGGGFGGDLVTTLGGGLVFRWDDIVPAVLPPERRLKNESCDAIETRFRACPNSRLWRAPEQAPTTPDSPSFGPTSAKPAPAATPPAPAAPLPPAPAPAPAPESPPAAPPPPAAPAPESASPTPAGQTSVTEAEMPSRAAFPPQ